MALLFKPLKCPHCEQPIDKRLLRQHKLLKTFLKRKPFPCPHCQAMAIYPEQSDTLLSMGLFVAVILAPLFHLWQVNFIEPKWLFGLGVAIVIAGSLTQKLNKA